MSDNSGGILLMSFIDESESFVLGFEAGQLWERIKNGEIFEKQPVHTKNIKQIEMICESFGVIADIEEFDSEWSYLSVTTIVS